MPSLRVILFAVGLVAALAQGCSRLDPKPKDVTLSGAPGTAEEADKRKAAELACKEETRRKGIASLVGIFSRFRQGSAEEDYLACMKGRGFEVKP